MTPANSKLTLFFYVLPAQPRRQVLHQLVLLLLQGAIAVEHHRLLHLKAVLLLVDMHRVEGQILARRAVEHRADVQPARVDPAVMRAKPAGLLRENHQVLAFFERLHALAHRRHHPRVVVNGDGRRALENRRQHGGGDIRQRRVIQRLQAAARLPPIVLPNIGGAGFAVHDALVAPHAHFVPQGELDHHVNRPERPDVVAHENAGIARKRLFPRRGHAGRDSTHNCAKAAIQSTHAFLSSAGQTFFIIP